MVRANKDAQNWDTKTLWRATSNGAVFSHVSSKRVPPTNQDGGPSPTRQPLPLMKIGDSVSLQQGTNVTGQRPPRSKIQTFSVQPVGAYVLPASDCGATCVVIAECIANVIVGSRWTTKKKKYGWRFSLFAFTIFNKPRNGHPTRLALHSYFGCPVT